MVEEYPDNNQRYAICLRQWGRKKENQNMLRKPTPDELSFINKNIAKKIVVEDDCYILDAVPANDYMLTCYFYTLGTSSLFNFKQDLQSENRVPMQINHSPDIPMGTWLPGEVVKNEQGYDLRTPLYMTKGLEINGYKTDELAKAYQAGHLTDVSISWTGGKPICDICHLDIRSSDCPHFPGMAYNEDGEIATCTIEDGHLQEISLVWKGGLPGAKLCNSMGCEMTENKETVFIPFVNWEEVKAQGTDTNLSFTMSMPLEINMETVPIPKVESREMTFDEVLKVFEVEIQGRFVEREEFIRVTQVFSDINAELEENREYTVIGKDRIEELLDEFNKVGIALYGNSWHEETEKLFISALSIKGQKDFMLAKIKTMEEELARLLTKREQEKKEKKQIQSNKDRDELYKIG